MKPSCMRPTETPLCFEPTRRRKRQVLPVPFYGVHRRFEPRPFGYRLHSPAGPLPEGAGEGLDRACSCQCSSATAAEHRISSDQTLGMYEFVYGSFSPSFLAVSIAEQSASNSENGPCNSNQTPGECEL